MWWKKTVLHILNESLLSDYHKNVDNCVPLPDEGLCKTQCKSPNRWRSVSMEVNGQIFKSSSKLIDFQPLSTTFSHWFLWQHSLSLVLPQLQHMCSQRNCLPFIRSFSPLPFQLLHTFSFMLSWRSCSATKLFTFLSSFSPLTFQLQAWACIYHFIPAGGSHQIINGTTSSMEGVAWTSPNGSMPWHAWTVRAQSSLLANLICIMPVLIWYSLLFFFLFFFFPNPSVYQCSLSSCLFC